MATQFLIQHSRNSDSCWRRIKALLGYHQMESGLSDSFYALIGTKWQGYLTDSILRCLLCGLSKLNLNICVPHWSPPPGRTVMAEFLHHEDDEETLVKLNTCMIFAKVHYVTDMITLDGNKLLPGALHGVNCSSKWKWPNYKPPAAWLETWSSYVRTYILPILPLNEPSPSFHKKFPASLSEYGTIIDAAG